MSKYELAVYIGRFQPFHNQHLDVIKHALKEANKILILIGSSNRSRSTYNPFTFEEREQMILCTLLEQGYDRSRITIEALNDHPYNDDAWLSEVQWLVSEYSSGLKNSEIALAGMEKDSSSYYINLFPQWNNIGFKRTGNVLSATDIRKKWFESDGYDLENVSSETNNVISLELLGRDKSEFNELLADYHYEQSYEKKWGKGPFVTVDACVIQAGHILLVTRGGDYGRNKLALPGGFLNKEKIIQGILRELREETKLHVPDKVLKGCTEEIVVFDDPYRSQRGHIITHCGKIVLNNVGALPKVYGSDDAKKAQWYQLSQIHEMQNEFFEDHYFMICKILNL